MKQCTKCKGWKDESEFHKRIGSKDGLSYWCKRCGGEYSLNYYRRDGKSPKKTRKPEELRRTINGIRQKRCNKCKQWKPENDFYKERSHKDGLSYLCKQCEKKSFRDRYKKDKKVVKEYYRYEERHRIVDDEKQKRCRRCKKWKTESEFYKVIQHKDGLSVWCKECGSKYDRKRLLQKNKRARRNLRYEYRHRDVDGIKQKLCCKCGKWKSESEFHKNRSRNDGLAGWCKECSIAAQKMRRSTKRYYKCEDTHQTVNGVKLKRCTKCKSWKNESEFRKDHARKDGLRIYCKDCDNAYARKRRRKKPKAGRKYLSYEERHRVVNEIKQKYCRKCGEWKKESEYYKQRSAKDGLTDQCQKCTYEPIKQSG